MTVRRIIREASSGFPRGARRVAVQIIRCNGYRRCPLNRGHVLFLRRELEKHFTGEESGK